MLDLRHAFPSQEPDEDIIIFLRRDILNFLPTAIILVFLAAFGILGLVVFAWPGVAVLTGLARQIAALVVTAYLFMLGLFFAIAWLDFYFDVHILTNVRLVDIDQNRLFSRVISELALENIEDVTAIRNGIIETLANFGDVRVETAGAVERFLIEKVPFPQEIANLITDLSNQAKDGVPPAQRHPLGPLRGIINGQLYDSDDELIAMGAKVPRP